MAKKQISARIDSALQSAVRDYCWSEGVAFDRFVEEALVVRLEELVDDAEVDALLSEPTRAFGDVLARLEREGRV